MKVCAMVDRSAGNESVGEMWTETAEFDESATLADVLRWARMHYPVITRLGIGKEPETTERIDVQRNVRLAILQDPAKGKPQ